MEVGLPFPLRSRTTRALSGEAVDKLKHLARSPSAFRSCVAGLDAGELEGALRKYDIRGYGMVDGASFAAALRKVGCAGAIELAFKDVDVVGRGWIDVEICAALCRFWGENPGCEQDDDDEWSDDEDWTAVCRAVSSRGAAIRQACERLDVAARGCVSRADLVVALREAGLALDDETVARLCPDATYRYQVAKVRDVGDVGRAYWRARKLLRKVVSFEALFESLARVVVISAADRASLWRSIAGIAPTVSRDILDEFFWAFKPFELPRRSPRRRVSVAPFADDDQDIRSVQPRRVLRRAPRAVGDESSPSELPQSDDAVLAANSTLGAARDASPPYWTTDAPTPAIAPPPRPPCPFYTDDAPPLPADAFTEPPVLCSKLRAAAARADANALRSTLRFVVDCSRGSLQSLAQHLGVAFTNAELESLCRWLDDLDSPHPLLALLDLPSFPPDHDDNEDQPHQVSPSLQPPERHVEREEEALSSEEEEPLPAVTRPPLPQTPTPIPPPPPSPPPPPPADDELPRLPEVSIDNDVCATLAAKLTSAPALASSKGRAVRLRHAFRTRARRGGGGPLYVAARGGHLESADLDRAAPRDVLSALRELGVDVTAAELRALLDDDATPSDLVRVDVVLARILSLCRHHRKRNAHDRAIKY